MASIEAIEGIGPANGKKLRASGIKTCERLLTLCCDKKGRKAVSDSTGIGQGVLLEWANRADLMRIRGVGSEYSDLLEAAGVDTVKELRRRKAENLTTKMVEVNAAHVKKTKKSIVRRTPALSEVSRWIEHAATLDPVITH
jgi:predicted flap endonuclease-1-like 5' DNA nuclease